MIDFIPVSRATYEDELIEQAVVPFLAHIDQDPDVAVRNAAAALLIDLCLQCDTKRCLELLDILEKVRKPLYLSCIYCFKLEASSFSNVLSIQFFFCILQLLNRPFEAGNDLEIADTVTVAKGVVHIFVAKMFQLPSGHAIHAYKILVNHLESHYRHPPVLEHHSSIRYVVRLLLLCNEICFLRLCCIIAENIFQIFECFLSIRANSCYQLGYPGGMKAELGKPLIFSPYLGVDHKHGERTGGASSPPPVSPAPTAHVPCVFTALSLTHACKAVISGLKNERGNLTSCLADFSGLVLTL